ncbi:MAG: DUF2520 domain-containing protein [Bacteroidota bacterium]|nr:DUF2520 domain-containing protein [Bacteroidota bacterium]
MTDPFNSIAIIGAGRVGSSLLNFFLSKNIQVSAVVDTAQARLAAVRVTAGTCALHDDPRCLDPSVPSIILCVPDDRIASVASTLASTRTEFHGVFVAHTSGLRTSDELRVLSERGAIAGSLHPIQSFPAKGLHPQLLEGIGCGIEGPEVFLDTARRFLSFLGWSAVNVRKSHKPLYHLACVFAGNFLTTLGSEVLDLLRISTEDGGYRHIFPMADTVIRRLVNTIPASALSGPIARGDTETLAVHVQSLRAHVPELIPLYCEFVKRSLRLVDLPDDHKRKILSCIGDGEG